MSFQAYLDAVEAKTGLTPRELMELGRAKGFDAPDVKAGVILTWLAEEYELGRGHGMAIVHVIKNGARISDKHVGTGGAHSDPKDHLWLDGAATKPDGY